MKSKIQLSPQMKKEVHKYVDKQLHIERGYIANCMLTACAAALHEEFGFGKDRIERFVRAANETMTRYYDADPDTWPDMAQRDCERMGVEFDGYWVKLRDREPAGAGLKLTDAQKAYLEESRNTLLSDTESKKIHDGWKVWK